MSENFDKEAERERLREKYEAESADREVTERMSQLLLQGATMTNKHCETCGSPIFRYQGQAFCPTCQAEADAAQAAAATGAAGGDEGGEPVNGADEGPSGSPSQPAAGDGAGGQTAAAADTVNRGHESVGTASTGTAELGGRTHQSQPAGAGAGGASDAPVPAAVTQSLAETIVSLSDRARESEDPNQAKQLLEAAREAAETLSRLQGR